MGLTSSIYFYIMISCFFLKPGKAGDLINQNETLTDGKTLVSSSQRFVLGFFAPVDSPGTNRYLGIWYKNSPQVVVWIANRERPIAGFDGALKMRADGNLVLLNGTKQIVWTTNCSRLAEGSVAQLLDSGNLVVKSNENMDIQSYTWQSFDFPTDTLLPGMKMGWNLSSGRSWYLRSWKNKSDPSPGEFTHRIDNFGLPQFVLRKGSEKKYRSGLWNGVRFNGADLFPIPLMKSVFVYDYEELYYMFEWTDNSTVSSLILNESGFSQHYLQNEGSSEWKSMYRVPNDLCDDYGECGPNGICRISRSPICECLKGFVPRFQSEWDMLNWGGGCIRKIPLDCKNAKGFLRLRNVKLPDLLEFQLHQSMTLEECERECLKNCNCTGYANSDIRKGGSGCLMWFGDLIDLREFIAESGDQDLYLRSAASELGNRKKKKLLLALTASITPGVVIALGLGTYYIFLQRKKNRFTGTEKGKENLELPAFQLDAILAATEDFSLRNRIGEGGFGPVYKGQLSNGQEIAVKRLSRNSGQGLQEFKNEVILISRLQHRNLVRLLGCCLDGEERMLIYEYMPNGSLDYFIFDQHRSRLLSWNNRFEIAMGIARGLLYLHQDSRLRIIHRDLKASNVLLDGEFIPKISDFGIAKTFGADQIEGKTNRVIGTYGYMSPEYAFNGMYSVKSDVFSLGVLLLELVSGRKNRIHDYSDQHQSLLGHAWLLWNEGMALRLMDECLNESFDESQMLRCIQVGLLCVQKLPDDRPTMATVVFMLSNEGVQLPQPKYAGFFMESSSPEVGRSIDEISNPENTTTMTMPEAR